MDDTHETIADIAAEKRRIAKEIRDHASNGDYWDKKRANETAEDLEEEADRLEVALRRERGDCAKLREALAPFPSLCEWLVENAAKLGIPDMVAKLRERGDKARAALAATEKEGGAE